MSTITLPHYYYKDAFVWRPYSALIRKSNNTSMLRTIGGTIKEATMSVYQKSFLHDLFSLYKAPVI